MQYLDQVAREQFGVRHYHEAQALAKRKIVGENVSREDTGTAVAALCTSTDRTSYRTSYKNNYMNSYINNCQQYYLDI
jgi:hypothetical protein